MTATMFRSIWILLALIASVARPSLADLERDLTSAWRGAWAIVRTETASDCNSFYTDNRIRGALATSKGDHRFRAGELVQIDKVLWKRDRVDFLVSYRETLLEPFADGPFTLYRETRCQAQLIFELGGKPKRLADVEAALAGALERHPRRDEAESSPSWNGRRREPYPPDYQETLSRHAAWKVEQTNILIQDRLDEATEQAERVTDRLREEPDYLAGFAAGVVEQRDEHLPDECGDLLTHGFYPNSEDPPDPWAENRDSERRWRQGYEDGQRLVWALHLLRHLPHCFLPVPQTG